MKIHSPILLDLATLACCLAAPPLPGAAAGQSLEARVQRLEDVESIRQLLERYVELNEARDYAGYAQLFARDGELALRVGSARGPAQIRELLEKNFGGANAARGPRPGSSHLLTSMRIDVSGDSATSFCRWTLLSPLENGRQEVAGKGHYKDELVREDGRWKFSKRTIVTDRAGSAGR
jgi:3-phenylpropionate/cinnamic acid dioxygenase small subunit